MRILIVGANGTLGKKVSLALAAKHELITAGRQSGDHHVDITSESSVKRLFKAIKPVDACICTAASGDLDDFPTLTGKKLLANMKGKLMGQVNLVLIGQHYLNDKGSFTLTSGVFADEPYKGVTGGGLISGALHSFVLSAAIELERGLRINAVSPGMLEDSAKDYGELFPGLQPVPMDKVTAAFVSSVETSVTGQIFKIYR